jgi:septum formation inhibitor MinC
MNLLDKTLEELGIKFEDLNYLEKETFTQSFFNPPTLTLDALKERLQELINSIAMQISNEQVITDEEKRKDDLLKARLNTYLTLYAFLIAPDKAEKAIKKALENRKK